MLKVPEQAGRPKPVLCIDALDVAAMSMSNSPLGGGGRT